MLHFIAKFGRRFVWTPLLATSIAALLAATPTFAATWVRTGAAGNDHWTNTPNWNPVSAVPNNGTADVSFGGTARLTPDMNANWSVHGVNFLLATGAFTLVSSTSSTLTIGAGGITNFGTDNQIIIHQVTLSAAQTWNAGSGQLEIEGAVNNGGYLLTIDGAVGPTFDGAISGGGGLTKNGLGDMDLVAANSYTGMTTVNAGQLSLTGGAGTVSIPGDLNIGDGVGTDIDRVVDILRDKIADTATVSVFSTGAWEMRNLSFGRAETITNLNIVSTGIAGGALVTVGSTLTILGNVTMTGGTVATTDATSTLLLNGNLTTNDTGIVASISSKLDLGNGARTFTIGDGAVPIDLDVTGVVSNGALVKEGPGVLRLGAANTFAGGTALNAGTLLIGNNAALGSGPLTGSGGTLQADGAARMIANAVSGNFAVDGAFDLTLTSPLNLNGNITKNGIGTLIFTQAGAIFDGLTVNAGTARFDSAVTFTDGLTNSATALVGTQTLTVNGAGLDNEGSLPIAGGTLAGIGTVVNNGLISGYGTIGGSGGFTNNAQLTVSGGSITLANAGPNANAGNISLPSGLQLRLNGDTLGNTGYIDLEGGIVMGTATLSNYPGGTVSGRGTISAPLANAGGTLRAVGGTMNVTSAFASSGVIRLDDGAGLAGGAITNTGRIQGDGTISNALTNAAGGSIRVDVGKTLFFTGDFATNAGELNLQGGTLDFTGPVINSVTGFIAGRGAIYTGGLTNSGQMAFSGGTTDIHGDVSLTAGSRVVTSGAGSVTTFFDDVTHNGTEIFTGAGASSVFFGALSGAGQFTGVGTVYSIGDLRPGNSPASVSYGGSLVLGHSTTLTIELGGTTPGNQYDKVQVAGSLSLDGTLQVALINNFIPARGNKFDILDWGSLSGAFSSLQLPSLASPLRWNVGQLYADGTLLVIDSNHLPGDFNRDTQVTGSDIPVMLQALANVAGYQAQYVVSNSDLLVIGDFDSSGSFTNADMQGLLYLLGHGGIVLGSPSPVTAAVPEPSAIALAALGLLGLIARAQCREISPPFRQKSARVFPELLTA